MTTTPTSYLLGHADRELQRLEQQAAMLSPATRLLLELAGIGPGMRVLDLGTGAGDVAFEVAELVGPSGSVLGIDQSSEALRWAARRLEARELANVAFLREDLHTIELTERFDAVVGRLVLLYTPDPAAVLRRYAALLIPGGRLMAMEYDIHAAGTVPPLPLSAQVTGWITAAYSRSHLDPGLGARLGEVMRAAGLADPTTIGLQTYFAPDDPAGARMIAETVRTLLPVIERTGVASPKEVGIDTLEMRIAETTAAHRAIVKMPALVGAWARTRL